MIPVTPSGIEPATFRLVALYHTLLRHRVLFSCLKQFECHISYLKKYVYTKNQKKNKVTGAVTAITLF